MSVQIIAEIAQGFEGNPVQARLLMKAASAAKANAAKFQMVYADELATPDYEHYELFRTLEMADEDWLQLSELAKELRIELHLDIFGRRSLELAQKIGVAAIKIHGTDIANLGLLNEVGKSSIGRVLLGAGGAYLSELDLALEVLKNKEVTILLGFQGYPTQPHENQISRVSLLVDRYKGIHDFVSIGFADHADVDSTLRYVLAAAALGAGATTLEKHLTLGRVMRLEDYESALNPDEFFEFTQTILKCYSAIGSAEFKEDFSMSDSESKYREKIRRHVVASRVLEVGTKISSQDVDLKRTAAEQAITDIGSVYGKVLKKPVLMNESITSALIAE